MKRVPNPETIEIFRGTPAPPACCCHLFESGHYSSQLRNTGPQQERAVFNFIMSESNVMFNVGGVIYEVRKSLIDEFPSTVLARAVSQQWKKENCEDAIFIERDPTRFRYCLDYMRDKRVVLPHTESKEAFLTDMEYLGFDDLDSGAITFGEIPVIAAAKALGVFDQREHDEVTKTKSELKNIETELKYKELAMVCFSQFRQGRCMARTQVTIRESKYENPDDLFNKFPYPGPCDFVLLNRYLKAYGLVYLESPDHFWDGTKFALYVGPSEEWTYQSVR